MTDIQSYPSFDSVQTEPFEALVAAYFQANGFITSSNKWFWSRDNRKKQRGYRDVDVLAINGSETRIVSVVVNLDDKIRHNRSRLLQHDMLAELETYFSLVEKFLRETPDYSWIVDRQHRAVLRVLAYKSGPLRPDVEDALEKSHIEPLPGRKVIQVLKERVSEYGKKGIKSNNPTVKLVELMAEHSEKEGSVRC